MRTFFWTPDQHVGVFFLQENMYFVTLNIYINFKQDKTTKKVVQIDDFLFLPSPATTEACSNDD
jgi:hypothetical protein